MPLPPAPQADLSLRHAPRGRGQKGLLPRHSVNVFLPFCQGPHDGGAMDSRPTPFPFCPASQQVSISVQVIANLSSVLFCRQRISLSLSLSVPSGNQSKSGVAKVNFREKEKQVLDQILGRYDARIRPSGENGTGEYARPDCPGLPSPTARRRDAAGRRRRGNPLLYHHK